MELEKAQAAIQTVDNERWLGQTVEVLVEDQVRGRWRGRTPQNRLVFFEAEGDWIGELVQVQVTHTGPWSLSGELVAPPVAA